MAAELSFLHRLLNWNKKSATETVDAEQYAEAFGQFKKLLLEQYQIRIQAKTAKRLPINLTAKSTNFGTSPVRAALYFDELTIESEDISSEIDKILTNHQRLLLIGDPGAGKTTILLFSAINILMDENREQKLPLIINLATWQKGRDFKEWYAQSIAHTYSLSPVFVEELLRRNAVVPFFDGFDEVAEGSRGDCFQKMGLYFGDQRSRQMIVCSRKKEYAAAKTAAPVYAQIEVQPLSLAQIQKALFENGQSYAGDLALLYALDRDEHLAKAVETPFYLNTASFLFGKGQRNLDDFPFKAGSLEGRQDELVEIFVKEQVPRESDGKYLAFLAGKMDEENFLVFELLKMQPGWCERKWVYYLGLALFSTSIFSIISSWFGDWIGGLAFGFTITLFHLALNLKIRTQDIQIWKKKTFLNNWNTMLRSSFFLVLGFGIIFSSEYGLIGGFVGCLVFILLFNVKISGNTKSLFIYISTPYKRFLSTLKGYLWIIPSLALSIAIGLEISLYWDKNLTWNNLEPYTEFPLFELGHYFFPKMIIFFFSIPLLASVLLNHFTLRLTLYFENKLPLRLVTFLDRQTDQHIFEDTRRTINSKKQRGATWRFRHKILQDYFAGLGELSSFEERKR